MKLTIGFPTGDESCEQTRHQIHLQLSQGKVAAVELYASQLHDGCRRSVGKVAIRKVLVELRM